MGLLQYHFNGFGFSGRAVRVRQLAPDEVTESDQKALTIVQQLQKDADQQTKNIAYAAQRVEEGLALFLAEYTTSPVDAKDLANVEKAAQIPWTKVAPGAIASGAIELRPPLFTAKDIGMLALIYSRLHEPQRDEAEAILGKGMAVDAG